MYQIFAYRNEQGEPGKYIATVQMASGALIWHVFEVVHG